MHEETSTFACIAAMGKLRGEILKNTKNQYIKESSTFAKISDMNQLQMGNHKKESPKVSARICQVPLQAIKQVQ